VTSEKQYITVIISLNILYVVKIIHFIDRTGLFKISNLVLGGKEIVTSLHSSLEGQRKRQREISRTCSGVYMS
jgi:hypothetical protein